MVETLRMFPDEGVVAFYEEAPGGGDIRDIDSLRNRPAKDPLNWLANIRLHSSLDYFEVSHSGTATINHAGVTATTPPAGNTIAFGWGVSSADHVIVNHNLGYVPTAFVAVGSNIVWPGVPVQVDSSGGGRYVSVYCTTTQLIIFEWASIGAASLPAASIDYQYLIFKNPPTPTSSKLFEFDENTGVVSLAREKILTSRRYLSVVPGGTPFSFPRGRTIDLRNGAPRAIRADGTAFDPVPSGLSIGLLQYPNPNIYVYGGSLAYNGSFAGSGSTQVQAP